MHELSIAMRIVEVAMARAEGAAIRRITLEVGALTAVLPDALEFCFSLATEGTTAEGAELELVPVSAHARCKTCGAGLRLTHPLGQCDCGGTDLEWLSGDELKIVQLEVV